MTTAYVTGAIRVDPPISECLDNSPFIPNHIGHVNRAIALNRDGTTIVPARDEAYDTTSLERDLLELVARHGAGRSFTGSLTGVGDVPRDVWRIEIHDGLPIQVAAPITF